MTVQQEAQAPASPGSRRATVTLFGLSAVLILIFGLLYMVSSQQGGRGGDISLISEKGEWVDVTAHLVAGKYTVIDFYADWCANCKVITPYLEQLARARSDVAIRKVNVVNWDTPVADQYRVSDLPYLQMYGPNGALIADGADRVLAEIQRRFAQASI